MFLKSIVIDWAKKRRSDHSFVQMLGLAHLKPARTEETMVE